MKTGLYLALAFILGACSTSNTDSTQPVAEYKVDSSYDHPFFHTATWSYAWFMLEDDSGELSSAMADSLGNPIMDSTHYPHTAWCVKNESENEVIHYADALLSHDSLKLFIHEFTASSNDNLVVTVAGGKRQADYSTTFIFYYKKEDVSWTTIRQDLILNRETFHPGDTLKGLIDFACVQHWKPKAGERNIPDDTISIKGPFKTVIGTEKP